MRRMLGKTINLQLFFELQGRVKSLQATFYQCLSLLEGKTLIKSVFGAVRAENEGRIVRTEVCSFLTGYL